MQAITRVIEILRLCDGQGRLIIKKTLTLISYFSVAMSVWVAGKWKCLVGLLLLRYLRKLINYVVNKLWNQF